MALTVRPTTVLLACALLGAARLTSAAPARHLKLVWAQGDPRCIEGEDIASTVERTLGRTVFEPDAAPGATVRGGIVGSAVEGGSERFEARISLSDQAGAVLAERTLDVTGDCRRLDEFIAVVVTLMIDGLEALPTPLHVPPDPPRPAPSAAPGAPPPPPAHRRGAALALGVGAGLSHSLLPGVVGSAVLRGEVAPLGFAPLALTVRMLAPSQALADGVGGTFSAWTAELEACPRLARRGAYLGACVGVGSGAITGSSLGFAAQESHTRPVVLAPLLLEGAVRLFGPFWLRAEAGATIPLLRERWGFLDAAGAYDVVFRPAAVAPTASIGVELRPGS